jgi:hypothetical protein
VPVKLLAIHLCFLACWLTWPDVRRLLDFFVLHHQVPAGRLTVAWPRPWMGPVSFILKSLVVSWVVYQGSARSFERWIQRHQPENRFSGYYKVDRFERAGQVLPPVLDDPERWHSVVLFPYYFRATATVRTMDRKAITYPVKYDEAERILVLQPIDKKKAAIELTPRWLGPGRLTLEGTIDGVLIKAQVTRIDDQSYLLINRGFRWINERPFNR